MRVVAVVVGTSCLLLMALFVALFAVTLRTAADAHDKSGTLSLYADDETRANS